MNEDIIQLEELLTNFYEFMLKASNEEQSEMIQEYAKLIYADFCN